MCACSFLPAAAVHTSSHSAYLKNHPSDFAACRRDREWLAEIGMLADTPVNVLTNQIIGAAIEIHRVLGPGLLESTYMPCLQFELAATKLRFVAQRAVPILYKDMELDAKYRIDLLVEDLVVVEVKSLDHLLPVHQAQLLTYMRLTRCPAGLLINFNVPKLIDGVTRLFNPTACVAPSVPPLLLVNVVLISARDSTSYRHRRSRTDAHQPARR